MIKTMTLFPVVRRAACPLQKRMLSSRYIQNYGAVAGYSAICYRSSNEWLHGAGQECVISNAFADRWNLSVQTFLQPVIYQWVLMIMEVSSLLSQSWPPICGFRPFFVFHQLLPSSKICNLQESLSKFPKSCEIATDLDWREAELMLDFKICQQPSCGRVAGWESWLSYRHYRQTLFEEFVRILCVRSSLTRNWGQWCMKIFFMRYGWGVKGQQQILIFDSSLFFKSTPSVLK